MTDSPTAVSRYLIHANGSTMGVYLGFDESDAVDAYAQDQGYDDVHAMADALDQTVAHLRAELTVRKIDSIEVEVGSIEPTDEGVDADVTISAAGSTWSGSITLYPDHGRPTVGRRHPLGTCGTPIDVWASHQVREAVQVLGSDLVGEIEFAVNEAAKEASC